MKTYTKYVYVNTQKRIDFVNITHEIEKAVEESRVRDGLVLVNAMHITASVFVNDAESGLIRDFEQWLNKLADKNEQYLHNATGEDNAYSHLWRTIMGREVTIAITEKKLDFGPWEQVFYGEFDGQRQKRVMIKVIGE